MNTAPRRTLIFSALIAGLATNPALALPPIWEIQTGNVLTQLDDDDESGRISISLPFSFSFDGTSYNTIWVYVGGVLTLGSEQELPSSPDPDDLSDLEQPTFAPFWSDIETNERGEVRYNAFADRAVITWDGVHADSNEDSTYTFQVQLLADGTIIYGYAGNQPLGDDDLNADLIVGMSDASPGPSVRFALDIPLTSDDTTIYQFFPEDSPFLFPLAESNLVFTPLSQSGFSVTDSLPSGNCDVDFAEPFGELDFFDVSTFITLYNAQDPAADLNQDGNNSFFDVSLFIQAFNAGCP
ncbi:MAG: hypothetical protein JJ916_00045 [Phycisphaerales bacterium]|nr:hypothetical protein [Phycisphaerales bacterium]